MDFLYIKGDTDKNVRLAKCVSCLTQLGHTVRFWGWNRSNEIDHDKNLVQCRYIYSGGSFGHSVAKCYPIWMLKLFFAVLFSKGLKNLEIIAVNFDAALPVFLACAIRRLKFSYEIRDEFALSYQFPIWLKWIILKIDHCLLRHAKLVIHVDENRVTYKNCKYVVIENSPEDYWKCNERNYINVERKFAVTGNLSSGRGIASICDFAEKNPDIKILMVGKFYDDELSNRIFSIPNIEYHKFIPQKELFRLMEGCCAIFSLYDPSLEINRLAASNKVYDAMMMGIPVITNKEVVNSKFILEKNVGIVVNYECDSTWERLYDPSFINQAIEIGKNGRKLYLSKYQFIKMIKDRLLPALADK